MTEVVYSPKIKPEHLGSQGDCVRFGSPASDKSDRIRKVESFSSMR